MPPGVPGINDVSGAGFGDQHHEIEIQETGKINWLRGTVIFYTGFD